MMLCVFCTLHDVQLTSDALTAWRLDTTRCRCYQWYHLCWSAYTDATAKVIRDDYPGDFVTFYSHKPGVNIFVCYSVVQMCNCIDICQFRFKEYLAANNRCFNSEHVHVGL
jgi:hypothetical protein